MTLIAAGEPVPDIQSKAKTIAVAITNIVGILTTTTVLALIPDNVVSDTTILAVGGLIIALANVITTFATRNKLTEPIVVNPPLPPVDPAVPVDGVI